MKVKSFKTKTNDGSVVRTDVCLIETQTVGYEDSIVIETTRIVPMSSLDGYMEINKVFPTFIATRLTDRYAVLVSRTTSMKVSTLKAISILVDEMVKQ